MELQSVLSGNRAPARGSAVPAGGVMTCKNKNWFEKANAFIERHYPKLLFFAAGYFLHGIVTRL
jgi:hypothetical protein